MFEWLLSWGLLSILGISRGQNPLDDLPEIPPPILLKYPEDHCLNYNKTETFDFVIVGGGSAGLVVARRLAENKCWKVLVLEAGGDPAPYTDIPGESSTPIPFIDAAITWPYTSIPSKNVCTGLKNGQCVFRLSKALGGSSQLNYMIYVRGNKFDYDNWEDQGNFGWSYEECLPFFKKSENFLAYPITENSSELTVSSKYHSRGGLLTINSFPQDPESLLLRLALIESLNKLGVETIMDINSESQIGITNGQGTIDAQHYRMSSARAFLLDPPDNLKVCKFADVDKILIKKQTAVGVSFSLRGGSLKKKVLATKEIVISGGTYNSPLILERSGIGDGKLLREKRIRIKQLLPGVGNNLHDHFSLLGHAWNFNPHSVGPINLKATGVASMTGFIDMEGGSSVPDIQIQFLSLPSVKKGQTVSFTKLLNFNEDLARQISVAATRGDILMSTPILLRPVTSGTVHIASKNQNIPPEINLKIFSDEREVKKLVKACDYLNKVIEQEPMKIFNLEPIVIDQCYKEANSSRQVHRDNKSRDYLRCLVHMTSSSVGHGTGTCKMGPKEDKMAVVDNNLRVHGIKRLRVIDASIMPNITKGNTNAPTIMIAEKGADFIKQLWMNKGKCHNADSIATVKKFQ